jgi:hypothetical protein
VPIYNVYTYATVKRRYVVQAKNKVAAEDAIAGREPAESDDLSENVRNVDEIPAQETSAAPHGPVPCSCKPGDCIASALNETRYCARAGLNR